MKRFISMMLAIIMVLSMGVVFAENEGVILTEDEKVVLAMQLVKNYENSSINTLEEILIVERTKENVDTIINTLSDGPIKNELKLRVEKRKEVIIETKIKLTLIAEEEKKQKEEKAKEEIAQKILRAEAAVTKAEFAITEKRFTEAQVDYNTATLLVKNLSESVPEKKDLVERLIVVKSILDNEVNQTLRAKALARATELVEKAVKWEDRRLQLEAEIAIDELVAVYGFSNDDKIIKELRRDLYFLITETDRAEKLERDAIAAVEKAEERLREIDVDNAWDAVEVLPKSNFKLDLEARIRKVEDKIYYTNQEKSLEVAIEMIEWAEKSVKRVDYDLALKVMDRVQPSREKTRLLERLAKLDAVIAKNEKPIEATEAEVKVYLDGLNLTVSPWAERNVYNASKDGLLSFTNLERSSDLRVNINREDFVEIIMNHVYANVGVEKINVMLAVMPKIHFSDTTNFKIAQAAQLGIINGMGDGTFAPRQNITREQMAVILDRVNKLVDPAAGDANAEVALRIFADTPMISSWARQGVANMTAVRAIEGNGMGMFVPKGYTTKEQAIKVIVELMK